MPPRALPRVGVLGFMLVLPGLSAAQPPHAMVATEQHYATQVGVDVLRRGGNAIDAAVAVAYALAVVDPCCGNIGGGGFLLVRLHDGRERFFDFRERAPLRANPRMYLDARGNVIPNASTNGYLAAGVPGTVMGLERARIELGTFPRHALMAPAIALARKGFRLAPGDVAVFRESPKSGALQRLHSGDILRQQNLAGTLQLIADRGPDAFYRGPIAQTIVAASRVHGGILSATDFARYKVEESAPIHCSYHGYTIASAPPPSSGGITLCEILNIIAPYPLRPWGWHSARSAHYVVEAERRAYADRNTYLGDPDFVNVPAAQLLSSKYAASLRRQIVANRATPSVDVRPGLGPLTHENNQTTHFSIVDRWGNAAALTYTINDGFGAGVIAGNTGFFLNDEMDDFTSKPGVPNIYGLVQGAQNDIRPGKRPLSSMAPTIVTRGGKLVMVTGSPGGSRIITIVLETILNALDFGMNAQQAVNAPRIHMQWFPDQIQYEPGALSGAARSRLKAMGYKLHEVRAWGSAQALMLDARTGRLFGGADRRRPAGLAAGY